MQKAPARIEHIYVTCEKNPRLSWQLSNFQRSNSPAYCLANLAMSSWVKMYCLVAIQCLSSRTARTMTPTKTKNRKQERNKAIVDTTKKGQQKQTRTQQQGEKLQEEQSKARLQKRLMATSWFSGGGTLPLNQSYHDLAVRSIQWRLWGLRSSTKPLFKAVF